MTVRVLSQAPERHRNFFTGDETLQLILKEHLNEKFYAYATQALTDFGEKVANEIDERAAYTDKEGKPKLLQYDKFGNEISEIWTNEGYKATVKETYNTGIVGYIHKNIPELGHKGNYTYSFAQGYLLAQSEPGFHCPVTLSMATGYLLDHYASDELKEKFLIPISDTGEGTHFEGATFLTERQGGSDVGANVVEAREENGQYRLHGEKYFASNAGMCGVAMVLARIPGSVEGSRGLTLFAVPWRNEDGTLNNLRIRKLKDKLGVMAVPSGEVEFNGAEAFVVGDPTRGFYYMMEALNLSRVCNAVASLGIMRRAYVEAREYASLRDAFGKRLTEFPMVKDSLGKLAAVLHTEMVTTFDFIKLYEKVTAQNATAEDIILNRLNIAIMKKETANQAIHFAHEAIEMHGGNGYMEEFVTPRLLRDAQVLTVWEGTANILGLELVRLVKKYSAHNLFIENMRERLTSITSENKQFITEKLDEFEREVLLYAELSDDLMTFDAKKISEKMAKLYEAIAALEFAEKHSGRYEKLADVYIDHTYNRRKIGDDMKTVTYFEELMGK